MIAQFMGRGEAEEIFSQPFGVSATKSNCLIRHRAQVGVKRDSIPRPQRMFDVRENLHVREMGSEKLTQTGAGKEILMVALQQVPGHSFPILEVGNDLDVWHGEERPLANDSRDLLQK
jgi:hypothetical protein